MSQIYQPNKLAIIMLSATDQELYTLNCLNSIRKYDGNDYPIYIIDNAENSCLLSLIQGYHKTRLNCKKEEVLEGINLTYIDNKKNIGVAAGWNQGIKRALEDGAEYICITGNDVLFGRKGCFRDMMLAYKKSDNIGFVTCMNNFANGNQVYQSVNNLPDNRPIVLDPHQHNPVNVTDISLLIRDYFRDLKILGVQNQIVERYQNFMIAPCASLFLMMFHRDFFEKKVGFFDEEFSKPGHIMFEDTDILYRMQKESLQLWIASNVFVWHAGNTFTIQEALRRDVPIHQVLVEMGEKSADYFVKKHGTKEPVQWYYDLKKQMEPFLKQQQQSI